MSEPELWRTGCNTRKEVLNDSRTKLCVPQKLSVIRYTVSLIPAGGKEFPGKAIASAQRTIIPLIATFAMPVSLLVYTVIPRTNFGRASPRAPSNYDSWSCQLQSESNAAYRESAEFVLEPEIDGPKIRKSVNSEVSDEDEVSKTEEFQEGYRREVHSFRGERKNASAKACALATRRWPLELKDDNSQTSIPDQRSSTLLVEVCSPSITDTVKR